MTDEQLALTMPPPATWTRPKGKSACGRDPAAGPGTCWHWWDGCPKAKKRGALSVTEALRGGLEGATEPPPIAELLEFCRIIQDKAKEPAP